MATLTNLPGVAAQHVEAVFASSAAAIISALRHGLAATAAGDHGAINVWRDDDGNYRCAFCVRFSVKSEMTAASQRAVRQWLAEWLPACHGAKLEGK